MGAAAGVPLACPAPGRTLPAPWTPPRQRCTRAGRSRPPAASRRPRTRTCLRPPRRSFAFAGTDGGARSVVLETALRWACLGWARRTLKRPQSLTAGAGHGHTAVEQEHLGLQAGAQGQQRERACVCRERLRAWRWLGVGVPARPQQCSSTCLLAPLPCCSASPGRTLLLPAVEWLTRAGEGSGAEAAWEGSASHATAAAGA